MIEHRFDHISDDLSRRNAWIDSLSPMAEIRIDRDTPVPPTVFQRHYNLKQIIFTEATGSAQSAERTLSHIASQSLNHMFIMLNLSGRAQLTIDGISADVSPNTLWFSDLSQTSKIESKGGDALGLGLPQHLLEACVGDASGWHGRVLPSAASPFTQLFVEHMRNLAACLKTATPPQKERIASATLALCNAVLLPQSDSAYNRAAVGKIAMRQFIDRHLATVDAEMLMARFGLSRTPLYKLFEAEGGVYAYIRSRRLALAMQRLVRASDERRPTIKQLTYACGFENEQVFSRAFRRKFGLNPSEVDAGHRLYADWDRTSRLMAWLKDI